MIKQFINPTTLPTDTTLTKADLDTPFLAIDLDKMDVLARAQRISMSSGDHTAKGINRR